MSTETQPTHELGAFNFAKTLRFTVLGDHPSRPERVAVVLDDGIEDPYRILTIDFTQDGTGPDRAPHAMWRERWTSPRDPWVRLIYGNAVGIVRQARAERGDDKRCGPAVP